MRTLEEVKEFFQNDVYATGTTGIEILEARPGYAKVSLSIDERHMNAANRVMGAVYYTMADFAFAVANNYDMEEAVTVTLSSQISFLSAAKATDYSPRPGFSRKATERLSTPWRLWMNWAQIAVVSSSGYRMHRT